MSTRLKTVSHALFGGVLIALMANFAFVQIIHTAFKSSAQAVVQREQTQRAMEQLRRETELLRRLVRAYTATGDAKHLLTYYSIYAVRQGEQPGPAVPDPSLFWEEAIASQQPIALPEDGPRQTLTARMKGLDVSAAELAALQRVLDATERLKKTEQIAFAATQGLYDARQQAFVSEGEPDLAYATRLVYSRQYEEDGTELTRAIAELTQRSNTRTEAAVRETTDRVDRFISMAVAVDVVLIPVIGAALMLVRRRVLQPINELSRRARTFAAGDYSPRGGAHAGEVDEVHTLSVTMDAMAESIESDLQARAQVQAALQTARDQAEAATKAKSLFLANMSHEIRTPMNAIIGMTHLALQTPLNPQQQDYLRKVDAASQILLGVINDILDFSKIEAGRLTLESTPYRVEDVVGNALMLVRQKAQEKELELLCEFSDPALLGEAAVVHGDVLRVGQILTNLLSNAVKFTHGGHVKISVALERRHDHHATLRFDVRDTGIGLAPDQLQRLFQEFTQADDSTTRRYGGTGLGLSISQRLAGLMQGEITVQSRQGTGSTFTFRLPVKIAQDASGANSPLRMSRSVEALRVLVVDDQDETRNSLVGLLRALGVGAGTSSGARGKVDVAANGQAALSMARAAESSGEPFDLVLLDWVLPDMNGAEVTDRLRHAHPELGVIVISAYGWDSLLTSATQAGADSFLAKPILPDALRSLFARLTGSVVASASVAALPEASIRLDGLRVLLVEDNSLNQQLAIELLSRRGATVKLLTNGCEAVEHLRMSGPAMYDVVLMDLQMPVMDGYEATAQIRADDRFQALPILAMTAHALAEERQRCLAIGMQDHISKPLEPHKLYATLSRYCHDQSHGQSEPAIAAGTVVSDFSPALRSLAQAHGVNLSVALQHVDGNHALCLRVLQGFADHLSALPDTLAAPMQSQDWPRLELEVHTLRGLCGTVGAEALAERITAVESAVKAREPGGLQAAVTGVLASLPQLLGALRELQNLAAGAQVVSTPTYSLPTPLHDALARHLQDSDSEAIELWRRERDTFKANLPPHKFSQLDSALEACDFDSALLRLQEHTTS